MIDRRMFHLKVYQDCNSTKHFLKLYICILIVFLAIIILWGAKEDLALAISYLVGFATIIILYYYMKCVLNKNKANEDEKNQNIEFVQSFNIWFGLLTGAYDRGSFCYFIKHFDDNGVIVKGRETEISIPMSKAYDPNYKRIQDSVSAGEYAAIRLEHCAFELTNSDKKIQIEGYFTEEKRRQIEILIKALKRGNYPICLKYFSKSKVLYEITLDREKGYPDYIINMVSEINELI